MVLVCFLDADQELRLHQRLIEAYGGSAELRDQDLLQSAIAMPQASFKGSYRHGDLFEMAAA